MLWMSVGSGIEHAEVGGSPKGTSDMGQCPFKVKGTKLSTLSILYHSSEPDE